MIHTGRAARCLLASAAVHGCLLAAIMRSHAGAGALPAPPQPLKVRLVAPSAPPVRAVTDGGAATAPDAAATENIPGPAQAAEAADAAAPEAAASPSPLPTTTGPAVGPLPPPPVDTSRPIYYLPKELDQRPALAKDVNPDLPLAIPTVPSQDVVLRLLINRDGVVDEVIVENELEDTVKDAITRAFLQVKFVPGKLDGIVVNSQLRIQVHLDTPAQVISSTVVH